MTTRLGAWSNWALAGSLGFVLVAGLGYCLAIGSQLRFLDEGDYLKLSGSVAESGRYALDGHQITAFRPPGYPYLLAALRLLTDNVIVLRSVNVLFVAVAVWASWWLARRIGGPVAAAIAAPLTAIYPLGFYLMGTLYPQTMGTALVLAGLVAVVALPGSRHPYRLAVGAGAAFGLLILTIPTFAAVLVIGTLWLVRRHVGLVVLTVLIGVAAVLPLAWMARNAMEMHAFIPLSTNNGQNLLFGNSEHAGPRTGVDVNVDRYFDQGQRRGLDEVELDAYYRQSAISWITAHPARAATLFVEKTANYFAPFDQLSTDGQSSGAQRALAMASYLPLLILFVLRLARWRRDRPGDVERLLIVLYLVAAPIQAIFFTRVRFRAPLDPLLIVIVAAMAARWLAQEAHAEASVPLASHPEAGTAPLPSPSL